MYTRQGALFRALLRNEHALVVTRFRSRCQELEHPLQPAFFRADADTRIAIQLDATFGAKVYRWDTAFLFIYFINLFY